jgi:glycosyltransferase involved in cell wall biosynthesis
MMPNDSNPEVTVLMPVYNGEKYLKEAIDSILNQTYKSFDFLIINDGSIDKSQAIIKSYNDSRIRLINNETNLGLIASLNKGLHLANSEYIARMDQDDISYPERLEKQVSFMEKHPEVGTCGTWAERFGDTKSKILIRPTDPLEIKVHLAFFTTIIHPTVMMRTDFLHRYNLQYQPDYIHAEDWELWLTASDFFKIAVLPEVLLKYRWHSENTSRIHEEMQFESVKRIRLRVLHQLGIVPTEEQEKMHHMILSDEDYSEKEFIIKSERWINELIKANEKKSIFDIVHFNQYMARVWYSLCRESIHNGLWTWRVFSKSRITQHHPEKTLKRIKLLVKIIIREKGRTE